MLLMQLCGISITVQDAKLFDRISIDIPYGEITGIYGPAKSGKSSLLRIISGHLRPDEGFVLTKGTPMKEGNAIRTRNLQDFVLYPWMTIAENLRYSLELAGTPEQEIHERLAAIAEKLRLTSYLERYPQGLGGDVTARALFARSALTAPDLLFLDNSFSKARADERMNLQNSLIECWQALGNTIVFSTDNLEEALYLCNTVYVLNPSQRQISHAIQCRLPRSRRNSDLFLPNKHAAGNSIA